MCNNHIFIKQYKNILILIISPTSSAVLSSANTISQCWLDNGCYITNVDLKRQRVTFQLEVTRKRTVNVDIPDCIANRRIPTEAKCELENFYKYLEKKYRL